MKKKKLELEICPKCGEKSYIVSIFGSICNKCGFEPNQGLHEQPTQPQEEKPQPQEEWEVRFYEIYNEEKGNIVRDLKLIDFIKNLLSEQKERIIKEIDNIINSSSRPISDIKQHLRFRRTN